MPRPPEVDEFTELSFIANYFLQGCVPPFWAVVEFSREPIHDLSMLFLELSPFDIAQAIFGPKGSRNRHSGRHGRKSRRFRGFPDPNDMVGDKIRTKIAPGQSFNWGPYRKAFKLLNVYERFNFSIALAGGITDVGFETLYGVLTHDEQHCPNMAYLHRYADEGLSMVGVAPWSTPFNVNTLANKQQFVSETGQTWRHDAGPYTVGASATVFPVSADGMRDFALRITDASGNVYGESGLVTAEQGESVQLSVEGEVPAGVSTSLSRRVDSGSVVLYGTNVFAFGGTWF